MVVQTNWYVITGGPSCGKTTTIEFLKENTSYPTFGELARDYIYEEVKKRGLNVKSKKDIERTVGELREDEAVFQGNIFERNFIRENKLNAEKMCFLERALPDSIAYYSNSGLTIDYVVRASNKRKYKKVFLLEQLTEYENDGLRTEDKEEGLKLSNLLFEAYTKLGYDVVRVPEMSVEERHEFILSHL